MPIHSFVFSQAADQGLVGELCFKLTIFFPLQVSNTLPHELFQDHDVLADITLNTTEIVRVANR